MADSLAAIVISRHGATTGRVRTIELTASSRSARAELVAAIAEEHRAPFAEADADPDEGRAVPVEAFAGLEIVPEVDMVNGVAVASHTLGRLAAVRDLVAGLLAAGHDVQTFVERV